MKTIVNKEVIKTEEHQRCTRKTRYLVTVMHDNFNEFNFCMVLSSRFDKELLYHATRLSVREVFGVCDVQIGRVSTWEADKMFEESDRLLAYTMEVDVLESLLGRYLLCIQDKMMEN